jgi:murein DD-endopeptidase MepM/ murein hydrolase activator NlpD
MQSVNVFRAQLARSDMNRYISALPAALLALIVPVRAPAQKAAIAATSCTFFGFYDAKGKLVQDALLTKAPFVDGTRVSDEYGWRVHPIFGYLAFHEGTDVAAPYGTPIHVLAAGVVEEAGRKGGYGLYVRVRHGGTYATAYAHASRLAPGIHPGARVSGGQVIAYVGSTGLSTGPHLHYEILVKNRPVRPACGCIPSEPAKAASQANLTSEVRLRRE